VRSSAVAVDRDGQSVTTGGGAITLNAMSTTNGGISLINSAGTYFPWVVAAISPHFPATRATGYASP